MLRSINLSLSSACGADCIYCPSNRGKRIKQKIMPFEVVEKVFSEVASPEFKKRHDVVIVDVGENGDAFLNRDILRILRFIKSECPGIWTHVYTNFQNFTPDKAEAILGEKLIDSFGCNIDGSSPENYFSVKRVPLEKTMRNLRAFLRIRKELGSTAALKVQVISLNRYIRTIRANFGFYPAKLKDERLKDIPNDFLAIRRQLRSLLDTEPSLLSKILTNGKNHAADKIGYGKFIMAWAEREKINPAEIDYSKYSCPFLCAVKYSAYIAPDGTCYACCLDSNNELVLGNVMEQSLDEIYSGRKRRELITLLEKKEFGRIGGPCRTVNCCAPLKVPFA